MDKIIYQDKKAIEDIINTYKISMPRIQDYLDALRESGFPVISMQDLHAAINSCDEFTMSKILAPFINTVEYKQNPNQFIKQLPKPDLHEARARHRALITRNINIDNYKLVNGIIQIDPSFIERITESLTIYATTQKEVDLYSDVNALAEKMNWISKKYIDHPGALYHPLKELEFLLLVDEATGNYYPNPKTILRALKKVSQ